MRFVSCMKKSAIVLVLASGCIFAQANKTSGYSLPYTPGLDVSFLDKSVDPCVDLYKFSCGGWIKKNPLPPDQASWGVYGKLQEENRELLHEILEQASKPTPGRSQTDQKIGDYYAACMNEAAANAAGDKPLQPDLQRIAALKSAHDLAPYIADLHSKTLTLGNSPLFAFVSAQDLKNSTQYIANVDQGGLGLPDRDYYI